MSVKGIIKINHEHAAAACRALELQQIPHPAIPRTPGTVGKAIGTSAIIRTDLRNIEIEVAELPGTGQEFHVEIDGAVYPLCKNDVEWSPV